jgi:hypothetical protein
MRCKWLIGLGIVAAGCGGGAGGPACSGVTGMSDLVARAEVLVVAVYGAQARCDGAVVAADAGPTEATRIFRKGEEIRIVATPGRHAVSLLAYADAGREAIGAACSVVDLPAGSDGCIDLTLEPPPDLVTADGDLAMSVDQGGDLGHDVGPSSDVAEGVLAAWDVGEAVGDALEACNPVKRGLVSLVAEKTAVKAGAEAVKVSYGPDGAAYFQASYPKGLNASWDVSMRMGITFAFDAALPATYVGWDRVGPTLVLCGVNGAYRRYDPVMQLLPKTQSGYTVAKVPIAGGGGWMVTDVGGFDPAKVTGLEVHVNPQKGAMGTGTCELWVDDVRFY